MHDILAGTNPSAKAITSIVTNPAVNGQVPFAKPHEAVLTKSNGLPQNNANNDIINSNNVPFITGLGGVNPNVMQNNGNNLLRRYGFSVVNRGPVLCTDLPSTAPYVPRRWLCR
ncbi:hypothetical protein RND81_04G168400 [Saponaria officinalis]|uniref:Uncharacterized protein n=1 Tax=Saponaria officinalis TaxID=3572 RepID=A0AAW1LMU6_SAPOF